MSHCFSRKKAIWMCSRSHVVLGSREELRLFLEKADR